MLVKVRTWNGIATYNNKLTVLGEIWMTVRNKSGSFIKTNT